MAPTKQHPVLGFIQHLGAAQGGGESTDAQLLDRFREGGDGTAFAALLRRHGPMVLGVCRRVLGHDQDAEDAFQATFLVLARKAGAIGKRDSVGSWLYGVAYRVSLKARTAAARRRERSGQLPELPAKATEDERSERDFWPVVNEELQRLPEKYRAPLVLCYLLGKTTDEAARELGWPRGTVGTRAARGRQLLRTRLSRRGVAVSGGVLTATLLSTSARAAVSSPLALSTFRAATSFAAEAAAGGTAISPQVAALAQGVIRGMTIAKLRLTTAVVLAVATASMGTLLLSRPARAGKSSGSVVLVADDKSDKTEGKKEAEEGAADTPANRARSQNNLKQIVLAMHNYLDATTRFPAQATHSKDGKPLLSWRVAILPYVDQAELYKEFKQDEPWDSEHNKKLLEKMPDVYAPPGQKGGTKTFYQVFHGKGTIFEGKNGIGIAGITDGTSNTIIVVEAGKAVPWTKPDDVSFSPDKPLPELGGLFKSSLNVAMADGSVRRIAKPYDEKNLRLWVVCNSGQVRPREIGK